MTSLYERRKARALKRSHINSPKRKANMDSVTITVQNLSNVVTQEEAEYMVQALNTQATRDYNSSPWVQSGSTRIKTVILLSSGSPIPPDTWHMEILDDSTQPGAIGIHEESAFDSKIDGEFPTERVTEPTKRPRKASKHTVRGMRADAPGVPLMQVFAKTAKEDNASVSEAASHEMLEAAVDPYPMHNPRIARVGNRNYLVEVGDPVQETGYFINGILVANFVLPAYYVIPTVPKTPPPILDFCHELTSTVPSLTPGGYISFAPISEPEAWQQEFGSQHA